MIVIILSYRRRCFVSAALLIYMAIWPPIIAPLKQAHNNFPATISYKNYRIVLNPLPYNPDF